MISTIMKLTRLSKGLSIFALIMLGLAVLGIGKCTYDRSLIESHDLRVENKVIQKNAEASEEAANRRVEDAERIEAEKEMRDAEIEKAPIVRPDPARLRLNCERLRRAGHDTGSIAACAGLDGSVKAANPS